jgi:hypothetical protein
MAKKSAAKPNAIGRADLQVGQDSRQRLPTKKEISLAPSVGERAGVRGNVPRPSDGRGIKGEGRPSSLLDTRVVYCGDNLEQLAKLPDACDRQMMKEECRMMNPAHFPILHSAFCLLNSPLPASHYVKVMLDQAVN